MTHWKIYTPFRKLPLLFTLCSAVTAAIAPVQAEESWKRIEPTELFYAEGAAAADFDGDGQQDVAYGPFIYYGPTYKEAATYYPPKDFSIVGYSDHFLTYTHDIDRDGDPDIVQIGFPGKESFLYLNPRSQSGGRSGSDTPWPRSVILEVTDNESPMMADVTGDGFPELVCCRDGCFGYAAAGSDVTQPWEFRAVSEPGGFQRFTHGIGVGDCNDDGRMDIMAAHGWWSQPEQINELPWPFHPQRFAESSAQMFAVDLTGDGRTEVISSLVAHGYGLAVYQKTNRSGQPIAWQQQIIMSGDAATSPTGLAVSQLHAVDIADIDRDGVVDIVTGKRFWAHQGHDVAENDPPLLVWFQTVRLPNNSVRFVPHVIDDDSGVGTQVQAVDLNGDGAVDILSGSKRGLHIFIQTEASESSDPPRDSEPIADYVAVKNSQAAEVPARDGRPLNFDFEAGDLQDWQATGAAFFRQPRPVEDVSDSWGKHALNAFDVAGEMAGGTATSPPFILKGQQVVFDAVAINSGAVVELIDVESNEPVASASLDGSEEKESQRQFRLGPTDSSQGVYIRISVPPAPPIAKKPRRLLLDNFRLAAPQAANADGS